MQRGLRGWSFQRSHKAELKYLVFDEEAIGQLDRICPQAAYTEVYDLGRFTTCSVLVRLRFREIKTGDRARPCIDRNKLVVLSMVSVKGDE